MDLEQRIKDLEAAIDRIIAAHDRGDAQGVVDAIHALRNLIQAS